MLKMDNHYKLLEVLLLQFYLFVIGIKTIFPPSAATAGFTYSSRY
jgi:hypothetical protein